MGAVMDQRQVTCMLMAVGRYSISARILLRFRAIDNPISNRLASPPLVDEGAAPLRMGGGPMSTILVVDPDEVLAYGIARNIRSAGCEVIAVSSTTAALALLDSKRIDLILVDIFMHKGQLSGLALARMARTKRRDIKLIFMTGSDDLQLYRQLVPGRLFHKPVDLKRLATEIATQLAM
jgi:CheY-like chemotaxis protein